MYCSSNLNPIFCLKLGFHQYGCPIMVLGAFFVPEWKNLLEQASFECGEIGFWMFTKPKSLSLRLPFGTLIGHVSAARPGNQLQQTYLL